MLDPVPLVPLLSPYPPTRSWAVVPSPGPMTLLMEKPTRVNVVLNSVTYRLEGMNYYYVLRTRVTLPRVQQSTAF